MIMNLRDHLFASAPTCWPPPAGKPDEMGERNEEVLAKVGDKVAAEIQRPLVGAREDDPAERPTATTRKVTAATRARSSTPMPCGRAPRVAPVSSSARWTSSTSITSSTCAATRS